MERKIDLSLKHATGTDPEQDGRTRLRGAFSIVLGRIRPDPAQPRREFDEIKLQELAASIRERGVRQPIRVFYHAEDKVYQIVSGERRFRAAQLAELPAIPCLVDELSKPLGADRRGIMIDQIVENWQRADLNAYELHDALVQLRDVHGLSQEEIARLTGKPKSEVSRLLSLEKIQSHIQEQLRQDTTGTFSKRHLQAIARMPEDEQEAFIAEVRDSKLTAVETERVAKRKATASGAKQAKYSGGTIRKYAVPGATVTIHFRRQDVTDAEINEVLDKVRQMIESRTS